MMPVPTRRTPPRTGVAAVETAFILIPLFTLLACTWEAGRLLEAQQVLVNAAREGARAAGSARATDFSGNALPVQANPASYSYASQNDYPTNKILQYISDAGYDITSIPTPTIYKLPGNTYLSTWDWQQQSVQGDQFQVTVQLSASKVRWIFLPQFINITSTLRATVTWICLKDTAVEVSTNLGNN
jgi:Flp pilus assembly protein TadG